MSRRLTMLVTGAIGVLWSLALMAIPGAVGTGFFVPLNVALYLAFLPGGLVLLLMIATIAARRFFSNDLIDGVQPPPGSRADIDRRVLTNTVEQLVLAMATWPVIALVHTGLFVIVLGVSFAVARLLFWAGYHISPPLRALGFAATFYPTIFALVWSVAVWIR